ncbi:MAG: shikimate dehydrogenase [Leadbetterella sp.]|nr:shikimate dehydrogenase [Leadbetterella sp.]
MENSKHRFGLIGFPLTHSFSKRYFTEKFEATGLTGTHRYDLFEIEDIRALPAILAETEGLRGLNVTIPHKLNVLPYLSEIDPAAERIGAVNVLKIQADGRLKGYNSDYYGFRRSLEEFLAGAKPLNALVLGNGGAARAIRVALDDMGIPYKLVSRTAGDDRISYPEANTLLEDHTLIINCTPLGTYPKTDTAPEIDYEQLSSAHFLYDLVYNPEETLFMKKGKAQGAKTINGYQMLVYQAEKSWDIWNS